MRNRHSLWVRLAFILGAMGLFVLGYQWGNRYQYKLGELPSISGVLVRPPAAIPGFTLRDSFGRTFDQGTLALGWALLAFGDLSAASGQLAIQRLIDIHHRVAEEPDLHRSLRLVLVTTSDAPNLARDFAALSPALHVLSGDGAEVERLRAALGAGIGGDGPLFVFAPGAILIALLTGDGDRVGQAEDLLALHRGLALLVSEQP